MLKIVNEVIAEIIPGLQVNHLRHGIEAVSKMAARKYVTKKTDDFEKIRIAMIHLSAHSEETSDAVYAGEEDTDVQPDPRRHRHVQALCQTVQRLYWLNFTVSPGRRP